MDGLRAMTASVISALTVLHATCVYTSLRRNLPSWITACTLYPGPRGATSSAGSRRPSRWPALATVQAGRGRPAALPTSRHRVRTQWGPPRGAAVSRVQGAGCRVQQRRGHWRPWRGVSSRSRPPPTSRRSPPTSGRTEIRIAADLAARALRADEALWQAAPKRTPVSK